MSDEWRIRLQDVIERQGYEPHEWGSTDCICQMAASIEVKSGIDYMADFRGKYTSYEGALELLREKGFDGPIDIVASLFKETSIHDAGDGDIGVVGGSDGTLAFGVFMKDKVFVQTERGMGRIPRAKALRAFKVPTWQQQSPPSSSQDSHP